VDAVAEERERELVGRFLARREEAAFRELYRAHTPYLFRLALRLCGGRRAEAEDAVQDAWLRAARALASFRWGSRLRTWLGGIVVNCCREQRRRAARFERAQPEPPPAAEPSAAEPPAAAVDVEAALAALPEGLREVLVLHVIEGYTHEEVAGLLGIAPGTSKSRLFDARVLLRRRLGERNEGAAS
jgi:RNA polymerase sigma-70 factor (ECF subfamily)